MKFIRLKDVIAKTGLARATIYKFMANDKFPKTISLGDRAVAWLDSDVDEWMLGRIALSEEAEA
ncbi:DNA-binding protein [Psychromonas sp. CNPT3]|uniref:AlpA family transcriptional regulator n=1 Tax=Psychromonas sp. CNPT3 TaxID=314282 RepID=UPI00006E56AB|nr:AlpA family transcriptional regulator [Psychromonas sp. CNPT3]AGH81540.1 DNA-binding protein [Psychromonas sp. CNPT3]